MPTKFWNDNKKGQLVLHILFVEVGYPGPSRKVGGLGTYIQNFVFPNVW